MGLDELVFGEQAEKEVEKVYSPLIEGKYEITVSKKRGDHA
jgi:hypothetical protein